MSDESKPGLPKTCGQCPASMPAPWKHGGRALVRCADDKERVRIADAPPPALFSKHPCPRRNT